MKACKCFIFDNILKTRQKNGRRRIRVQVLVHTHVEVFCRWILLLSYCCFYWHRCCFGGNYVKNLLVRCEYLTLIFCNVIVSDISTMSLLSHFSYTTVWYTHVCVLFYNICTTFLLDGDATFQLFSHS